MLESIVAQDKFALSYPKDSVPNLTFTENERIWSFRIIDAFLIFTSFFATIPNSPNKTIVAMVATLIICYSLLLTSFYEAYRKWSLIQIPYECAKGIAISLLVVGIIPYLPNAISFRPEAIFPGLLLSGLAVCGWRVATFRAFSRPPVRRTAIVGSGSSSLALIDDIRSLPHFGFEVLSIFSENPSETISSIRNENIARLPFAAAQLNLDLIIVDDNLLSERQYEHALDACIENGMHVVTALEVQEKLTGRIPIEQIDKTWFIMSLRPSERTAYGSAKRFVDIIVSIVGLTLTLTILPFISLAMKIGGGPGPIFYSQTRIGFRGKEFKIYKFRSMRTDAESSGAIWATDRDERVTKLGRFLRSTRLDELPQFWNVLKGEMSVVGPRPERPEFVQILETQIPFYSKRHLLLPGLTGWAQVMFPYSASVDDTKLKLQYDLYYIKNRSFFLDIQIMIRTIGTMARKIGSR